jgi:chromosome segregation ATPase
MASRSSTGVIVALVVFVVLSVSLLAVSIILYTDKSKAELSASEANAELNKFISADERGRTETQDMLGKTSDSSLFEYLTRQSQDVAEFVSGNRTADIVAMRTELSRSNKDFSDKETVNEAMRKLAQDRDSRKQGEELLKTKSNDLSKELDALKQRLAAAEAAHAEAVAKITASIATYQVAADGYRGEFDSAKASLDESRSEQKSRFESESASLQSDIDSLRAERSVLDGRIGALQAKVESSSMKAANPAALVDSRVVDVDAKTGTIFIDIGSNRRVVPGMTFEVFDDSAGIVASASSGARG